MDVDTRDFNEAQASLIARHPNGWTEGRDPRAISPNQFAAAGPGAAVSAKAAAAESKAEQTTGRRPAKSISDYRESWLAKPVTERKQIIAAWGELIIAGMSAEKVYDALPTRTCSDLDRRFTFKITHALTNLAESGAGIRSSGKTVTAAAALKLIGKILADKGLEVPTAPPPSCLSETITKALRRALSLAPSDQAEAIAALTGINALLETACRDLHDINVAITENTAAAKDAA
jgi:hypothetical protein